MPTPILPDGFVRLRHIIGDPRRGIPPIIPISRSAWWAGVAAGRYPASIRHGGVTMWRVRDIMELCRRIGSESGEGGAA